MGLTDTLKNILLKYIEKTEDTAEVSTSDNTEDEFSADDDIEDTAEDTELP